MYFYWTENTFLCDLRMAQQQVMVHIQQNKLKLIANSMGGFTGGGGLGGGLNPSYNLSNPSYKVFNPTKILLHPSYFVWKSLTLMPNPVEACSVVPLAPHQKFFYPSFKKNENPPLANSLDIFTLNLKQPVSYKFVFVIWRYHEINVTLWYLY